MDIKKIKSIAEIFDKYGLTEIEYVEDKDKIVMKRDNVQTIINEPIQNTYNFSGVHEVKAPLIGVFYIASSPDAKPFVEIGSKVKKGDILCIIEAMKLMNEINADCDGEIVDICAGNGAIVEYNQTLFKII